MRQLMAAVPGASGTRGDVKTTQGMDVWLSLCPSQCCDHHPVGQQPPLPWAQRACPPVLEAVTVEEGKGPSVYVCR